MSNHFKGQEFVWELYRSGPVLSYATFGSRYIGCASEDSDYDWLLLVKDWPKPTDILGYEPDAAFDDYYVGSGFRSYRKGDVNLVFTTSESFFHSTKKARDFCYKYQVFDKVDRIMIHDAIRNAPTQLFN